LVITNYIEYGVAGMLRHDDTSARARFARAQESVLAELDVEARASFLRLDAPPMRVHLTEAGSGPPLLMVHGGNSVSMSWGPLMPLLAPRFRLLMPDRPGCGLTGRFDYRGVALRRHGAQFLSGVLDALGLEQVAVAGNSMGGFFAMALALAEPERVSRLVLLGEPAGADGHPRLFHRLVGTRGLNGLLYATALRPPEDADGARRGLARSHLVAHPERVSPTVLACLAAAGRLPGATHSWRTMVEQVFVPAGSGVFATGTAGTHALLPELGRLTAPTLFLWGDEDPLGSPEAGRALAERMPDAQVRVVPGASHLVWLDQPDLCAQAMTDFLEGSPQ
jgi:pimeloyl-ACP methyl ester carboxylesterase